MADDLLARGAAESRKRAAVLRQLAAQHRDDSLLTSAATADAEADLLDEIDSDAGDDRHRLNEIRAAAETLARLLVKED